MFARTGKSSVFLISYAAFVAANRTMRSLLDKPSRIIFFASSGFVADAMTRRLCSVGLTSSNVITMESRSPIAIILFAHSRGGVYLPSPSASMYIGFAIASGKTSRSSCITNGVIGSSPCAIATIQQSRGIGIRMRGR